MSVKARVTSLNSTPTLLESPNCGMVVKFFAPFSAVAVGGSDLTSSANGVAPTTGLELTLNRGDDLYAVSTSGTTTVSYLAIGS